MVALQISPKIEGLYGLGRQVGSISAALSCLVYVSSGRSAGSFPEQRLVIEPSRQAKKL